jgi:KipI family sensor histidine kinase inhibitor
VNVLPFGDTGLLIEVDGLPEVLALADAVRAAPPAGVLDIVPAARTVLLTFPPRTDLGAVRREVLALTVEPGSSPPDGKTIEISVIYDGPDLDEVGRLTGLDAAEVVKAHTGTPWRVAFGGFAPGFAYLAGGDPRLDVERRSEPRTSVPAGAVGLAGEFSGIYPRASPGGWQLIGHTDAVLWDVDNGALLEPGGIVRFVEAP